MLSLPLLYRSRKISLTVDNALSDLLFRFEHIACAVEREIDSIQRNTEYCPEKLVLVGWWDSTISNLPYIAGPSLTTVRQPLQKMGVTAARTLLNRIDDREDYVAKLRIEPELVVRNSTAAAQPLGECQY